METTRIPGSEEPLSLLLQGNRQHGRGNNDSAARSWQAARFVVGRRGQALPRPPRGWLARAIWRGLLTAAALALLGLAAWLLTREPEPLPEIPGTALMALEEDRTLRYNSGGDGWKARFYPPSAADQTARSGRGGALPCRLSTARGSGRHSPLARSIAMLATDFGAQGEDCALLDRLARRFPWRGGDADQRAELAARSGYCYLEKGDLGRAARRLNDSDCLSPYGIFAPYYLGEAYFRQGKNQAARRAWRRLVQAGQLAESLASTAAKKSRRRALLNWAADAYNAYSDALNVYLHDNKKGKRYAERAVRLNPGSFDLRYDLVSALEGAGQTERARRLAEDLIREMPTRTSYAEKGHRIHLHFGLAGMALTRKRSGELRQQLEQLVQLYRTLPEIRPPLIIYKGTRAWMQRRQKDHPWIDGRAFAEITRVLEKPKDPRRYERLVGACRMLQARLDAYLGGAR